MAEKLALDQGISFAEVEQMKQSQNEALLIKRVQLKIDFTKLAKIAYKRK